MSGLEQSEVLVVGAGPVGMFTALLLAQGGITVKIIDEEPGPTTHSYACGLHPRTLSLLEEAGLANEVLERGQRIDKIAFYEGGVRRDEINLAKLPLDFPFLLVLPQSDLERLLEEKLRREGVNVIWNHRFSRLLAEDQAALGTVEKLGETMTGYIVPHWETTVMKTVQISAAFVIGADGHNSFVRRALGIDQERVAEPELFEVYEFETDSTLADEIAIVLDKTSRSALWPLPQGRARWSFQRTNPEPSMEFPEKDRNTFWLEIPWQEANLRELLKARAPWFSARIKEMRWATEVRFEHRVAAKFGQGRCWLAGDAAHQTGPVGMQSMNVGFREAKMLVEGCKNILRERAPLEVLDNYGGHFRNEWQRLLGITGKVEPIEKTSSPLAEYRSSVLECLPGSGEELEEMLNQLNLEVVGASSASRTK